MSGQCCFVVTDIEADGPDPGTHSMISFASVVINSAGNQLAEFSAAIWPLPELRQDPGTMAWWAKNPEAWTAATTASLPPEHVIPKWATWLHTLPGKPVFTAHPLSFDGAWMDWYLQRFTGRRLFDRPRQQGVSHGSGLDLPTLVMATQGWKYEQCNRDHYPPEWLGGHQHSHCALDDARGYAYLLKSMLRG